ncbi:hypothetical protein DVK85_04355 [Flavobacterium arcticum]|uniref:Alpha-ketoglutarate decarboxylase n=1 Tax=Flavobacterium arcticum TaxID=1784713 RepID=A0A345HA94_9FLAO|nr:hypothetical protein [Flavobacterium arcticum]AXG73504.1 hypothetical protein DVK85_04355 [Flavobacterium arcticum]KAF2513294.1 hypothetical protein E0W72_02410 [Flavobacterium arcticum]
MKTRNFSFLTNCIIIITALLTFEPVKSQNDNSFWGNVSFGGTAGVAFGNNYTDVTLAPGALYNINEYVGVGLGLQGTYVRYKDFYESYIYGASIIGVFNPIPEIQLSAEVEQLRVNISYDENYISTPNYTSDAEKKRDFWNTALFLGAGYRQGNATIGVRYNVLFRERDMVYSDAFMPFIRVYF